MAEAGKDISSIEKAERNSSECQESFSTDSEWQTTSDDEEPEDVVYQFKVTLKHIKPPIWRRILISKNSTFAELHCAIIGAMGWLDSHLHAFQAFNFEIAPVEEEENKSGVLDIILLFTAARKPKKLDETKVKVWEYFRTPNDSINYLYDFVDNWLHSIVLEKILPCDNKPYPTCIAGKRACPPDDCGGVPGYERLLKILSNPDDPEHQGMKDWIRDMGKGDFDPEAYNPDSDSFM